MAENESLDLSHCNSGRWRSLNRLVQRKHEPGDVAQRFDRCLYQLVRSLIKEGFPLDRLLLAAKLRDEISLQRIVREVRSHRDYAELFGLVAPLADDSDTHAVCVYWLQAIKSGILEQFRQRAIGAPQWRDLEEFNGYQRTIELSLEPRIIALATKLVANPSAPPRLPRRSDAERAADQKELLRQSLISGPLRPVPEYAGSSP